MKVLIAGGGTAGHVNPALALAGALTNEEVVFVGTRLGAEATLVPRNGFRLETMEVRGFDRARPLSIFGTGVVALKAVATARRIVARHRPDVVVGVGGYVSLPVCLAARSKRIPVVIHEQNVVFGLANRVCRRFARVVAVSFEDSLAEAGRRGVVTGNPVSAEIAAFDRTIERAGGLGRFDLEPDFPVVLVFGGSQGARRINEAALGLAELWADRTDIQIVHIVGRGDHPSALRRVSAALEGRALVYRAVEFVDRMTEAYAAADLAVCRGGATTIAELGSVGLPAIVVPYPYHRDRQQERHGRILERAGAARVLLDAETTPERLAKEIDRLLGDEALTKEMREAARSFGRPDAAVRLAEVVRETVR